MLDVLVGTIYFEIVPKYPKQPIVIAGENQTVAESSIIMLDGSKSRSIDNNEKLQFTWKQISPNSPILNISASNSE